MSLELRALKSSGAVVTTNPDQFIKDVERGDEEKGLATITSSNIKYDEWKRVPQDDGKKQMMIVTSEVTKIEFQNFLKREILQFREHIERVNKQWLEVRKLKDNLPAGHVLLQMDFAKKLPVPHSRSSIRLLEPDYGDASSSCFILSES